MMHDFREIAPTFVLFAPRVWEAIAADVRAGVMDSSPLKQCLYDARHEAGPGGAGAGQAFACSRTCCCSARCATASASRRLRSAATGGAALGPDTFRFFQAHGRAAAHALRPDRAAGRLHAASAGDVDPDTVGRADGRQHRDPHRRTRISTASARSSCATPTCSSGYYKSPEASAADMQDGWMHTGDAGYFNDNKAARRHRPHQGPRGRPRAATASRRNTSRTS